MAHDWPENIRELENAIERAFTLCDQGVTAIEHLPEELSARYTTRIYHADMARHPGITTEMLAIAGCFGSLVMSVG